MLYVWREVSCVSDQTSATLLAEDQYGVFLGYRTQESVQSRRYQGMWLSLTNISDTALMNIKMTLINEELLSLSKSLFAICVLSLYLTLIHLLVSPVKASNEGRVQAKGRPNFGNKHLCQATGDEWRRQDDFDSWSVSERRIYESTANTRRRWLWRQKPVSSSEASDQFKHKGLLSRFKYEKLMIECMLTSLSVLSHTATKLGQKWSFIGSRTLCYRLRGITTDVRCFCWEI